MENLTLKFTHLDATSLAISGGKGANLSKMALAGFPVPPGFIISTQAFELFLAQNRRKNELNELITSATRNLGQLKSASAEIRDWICSLSIPDVIKSAIQGEINDYSADQYFAVRSSATAEDLSFLSFAGQQDTYLNIQGLADLLEHIQRCWASLFTERAMTYRTENHISHEDISMAVVVQKMAFPQVSGILFTADPISNDHEMLTINASYGLGEALVSGLVNPDLVLMDKDKSIVQSYTVAQKKVMISALPGGGTQQLEVPEARQAAKCLTDDQAQSLGNLGKKVEQYYGTPQDIEWALDTEQIYLLQTRPITSLFPLPDPPPQDGNLHIYLSIGHLQMNTETFSPLGLDIIALLFPFGRPPLAAEYSPYVHYAAGRMYADLNPLLANKLGRKGVPNLMKIAEPVAGKQISAFIQSERFNHLFQHRGKRMSLSLLTDWLFPVVAGVLNLLLFAPMDNLPARMQALNQTSLAEFNTKITGLPLAERLFVIKRELGAFFKAKVIRNAPPIGVTVPSLHILNKLFPSPSQQKSLQAVGRGLSGNITTEMDLQVADLADCIATDFKLRTTLEEYLAGEITWQSVNLQQFPRFQAELQNFLSQFGSRTPGELDIAKPRWHDDPRSLLRMVMANVASGVTSGQDKHRLHFEELRTQNLAAQQELLNSLGNSPGARIKRWIARRLLKVFTNCMPCRENPKFLMVQVMDVVRSQLLDAGNRLVEGKLIDQADDIWFLRMEEILQHFSGKPVALQPLISQRKLEYAHYQRLTPPRVMLSTGEILRQQLSTSGIPTGALAASPVSAGIVEGIAHIIRDPSSDHLNPGEILVAPFTDPGWTPLFVNAAGLVLETGGSMTHGSVVAREYGIPAVVGVVDATTRIKTGMRIRVNGDLGYVEILE